MYPCRGSKSYNEVKIKVYDAQNTKVGSYYKYDQKGFGVVPLRNLKMGQYTIQVEIKWIPQVHQDYTVRVYSSNVKKV